MTEDTEVMKQSLTCRQKDGNEDSKNYIPLNKQIHA